MKNVKLFLGLLCLCYDVFAFASHEYVRQPESVQEPVGKSELTPKSVRESEFKQDASIKNNKGLEKNPIKSPTNTPQAAEKFSLSDDSVVDQGDTPKTESSIKLSDSLFDEEELAKRAEEESVRNELGQKPIRTLDDLKDYISYVLDSIGRFIQKLSGTGLGDRVDDALKGAHNDIMNLNTSLQNASTPEQVNAIKSKVQQVTHKLSQVLKSNEVNFDNSYIQNTLKTFNTDIQKGIKKQFFDPSFTTEGVLDYHSPVDEYDLITNFKDQNNTSPQSQDLTTNVQQSGNKKGLTGKPKQPVLLKDSSLSTF